MFLFPFSKKTSSLLPPPPPPPFSQADTVKAGVIKADTAMAKVDMVATVVVTTIMVVPAMIIMAAMEVIQVTPNIRDTGIMVNTTTIRPTIHIIRVIITKIITIKI